jgi:hypothetical protein
MSVLAMFVPLTIGCICDTTLLEVEVTLEADEAIATDCMPGDKGLFIPI